MTIPTAFRLNAQVTVDFESEIDLVSFLQSQGERGQKSYFKVDLSEWGFDDEYQRPMAFLCQELSESIEGFDLGEHARATSFSGTPEWDRAPQVQARSGAQVSYRDQEWTPEDYATLVGLVSWMKPLQAEIEGLDEADRRRLSVHPDQTALPI